MSDYQEELKIKVDLTDVEALERALVDVKKDAKSLQTQLNKFGQGEVSNIQKTTKALKAKSEQQQKLTTQLTKAQKAQKDLAFARSKEGKELLRLRQEIVKTNAQTRESLKLDQTKKGTVERLTLQLRKLKRGWNQLTESEQKNTRVGRKLDAQIKRTEANLARMRRTTKSTRGGFLGLGSSMGSALPILGGVTAGFAVLSRGVGDAFRTITGFQQANSNLKAILSGTVTDTAELAAQMAELTAQSKSLGATTSRTAGQVASLQTEFARKGFGTDKILELAESTIFAADALRSDLGAQAELTGGLLNALGEGASQAARFNDVLASAAGKSALDFNRLNKSLGIAAPVARAAGEDVESLASKVGILADANIDASSAGTGLRNMFLRLADQGITWEDALDKINNSSNKLTTANELLGTKGATVGLVLAENQEKTKNLEAELRNAAGTAQQMADEQLNNLNGSLTKLNSAWEGLILSFEDGEGGFAKTARAVVDVTTALIGFISGANKVDETLTGYEKKVQDVALAIKELLGAFFGLIKPQKEMLAAFGRLFSRIGDGESKVSAFTLLLKGLALQFKLMLLPLELLFKAITWVIDKLVDFIDESPKVQAAISDTIQFFKDWVASLKEIPAELEGFVAAVTKAFSFIAEAAVKSFGGLQEFLVGVFTLDLDKIRDGFNATIAANVDLVANGGKKIAEAFTTARDKALLEDPPDFENPFAGEAAKEAGKTAGESFAEGFKEGAARDTTVLTPIEPRQATEVDRGDGSTALTQQQEEQKRALKARELALLEAGKTQEEIELELLRYKQQLLFEELTLREEFGKDTIDQELEIAKIRAQIAEKTAAENKKRIDEELKQREEAIAKAQKFAVDASGAAIDLATVRSEAALETKDAEITAAEESRNAQRLRAEQGLSNTLAFEEERLQGLREAREREAKRIARLKKAEIFRNLFAGYAQSEENPATALAKATRDFALGESFAAVFSGFRHGGYTGDGGEGQVAGVTHGKEFVFTADKTAKYRDQFEAIHKGEDPSRVFQDRFLMKMDQGELQRLDSASDGLAMARIGHSDRVAANAMKGLAAEVKSVKQVLQKRPTSTGYFEGADEFVKKVTSNGATRTTRVKLKTFKQ